MGLSLSLVIWTETVELTNNSGSIQQQPFLAFDAVFQVCFSIYIFLVRLMRVKHIESGFTVCERLGWDRSGQRSEGTVING